MCGCRRSRLAAQVLDLRDNGKRSGVDQIRLNQQIRHGSMDITKAIGDLMQTMTKEATKRKVRSGEAVRALAAPLPRPCWPMRCCSTLPRLEVPCFQGPGLRHGPVDDRRAALSRAPVPLLAVGRDG